MKRLMTLITGGILLAVSFAAHSEQIRDYYAEPGIQAFKGYEGNFWNENIDTFGGTLQPSFVDGVLPGNGGLDIKITRTYISQQDNYMQYPAFFGLGWSMHFGRIVVAPTDAYKVCDQPYNWSYSTADNPSLELPDGSRELLLVDQVSNASDANLITKTNWRVTCKPEGGFIVRSPDGLTYIMDQVFFGDTQTQAWYTSKITDKSGNTLNFTYGVHDTAAGPQSYLLQIDASDGRQVKYQYSSDGFLTSITLNTGEQISGGGTTRVISYEYADAAGMDSWTFPVKNLTKVTLPEKQVWNYDYYPRAFDSVTGELLPSASQLKRITLPTGAYVDYTYQSEMFRLDPLAIGSNDRTFSIATKTMYDLNNKAIGTWTYTFNPGALYQNSAGGGGMDQVRIDGPESSIEYQYYGLHYVEATQDLLWAVGLPYKRLVYPLGGTTPLEERVFGYDKRIVSPEIYWHGKAIAAYDNKTYAALKTSEYIARDGMSNGTATYFENFDAFGNPQRVRQSGDTNAAPQWKVTDTVFQNDILNWVIGMPQTVTEAALDSYGATLLTPMVTSYFYDDHNRLTKTDTGGVINQKTYDTDGTILTSTDPLQKVTTFSDYHRGQARQIRNPDGTMVFRQVDDFGQITSITDELGSLRMFSYDDMGRLTGITYPKGSPVVITYGVADKTLTRGSFLEHTITDGWGHVTQVIRSDTLANNGIEIDYHYSPEGHKIFTSYPNSGAGTSYQVDALGRVCRVTHPDGKFISTTFQGPEQTVIDEKGNMRSLLYHSYGTFDDGHLVDVKEAGVTGDDPGEYDTTVTLNVHEQPTQILQGIVDAGGVVSGHARSYAYDANFYLWTETNPETGLTTYTRDLAGNMLTKQVGSLPPISFVYDDRGRLTNVNYASTLNPATDGLMSSESVSYDYYADGKEHHAVKGGVAREYQYDENGNLTTEKLTIDGTTLQAAYDYDGLDYMRQITYPSGRVVDYAPSALGRATKVGSYVPFIDYHPTGQLKTLTYANGVTTSIDLNPRMMVSSLHTYGSQGDFVNRTYGYDDTENITAITDLNTPSQSRTYNYDQLGRLVHAITPWGEFDYGYSRNDELSRIQVGTVTTYLGYSNSMLSQKGSRNYYHDAMGNISSDLIINSQFPQGTDKYSFLYDQSGSLRNATRDGWTAPKQWRYDAGGMRVVDDSTSGSPTYYFHNKAGQLLGEYKANLAYGKETVFLGDHAVVSVKTNEPPVANAGANVTVFSGQQVTLDGSNSTDPEGRPLTYSWVQTAGPTAQTGVASANTLQVTAPSLAVNATLTFQLTVTDEKGATSTSAVNVAVNAAPAPVANAGPDQVAMPGDQISLNGASSTGSGSLQYSWSQISGPAVVIYNPNSATPYFYAPSLTANDTAVLNLTVTDGFGRTASDQVSVSIISLIADTDGDGLPDGWEQYYFGSITAYNGASDPDGDGLTNAQEYSEGTNPLIANGTPTAVSPVAEGGDASVLLQWPQVVGVARYSVYWSNTSGFSLAGANKVTTTSTRFVHAGLTNNKMYYYRVVAENNTGASSPSGEVSALVNSRVWKSNAFNTAFDKLQRFAAILSMYDPVTGAFTSPFVQVTDTLTGKQYRTYLQGTAYGAISFQYISLQVGINGSVGVAFSMQDMLYAAYVPPRNTAPINVKLIGQYCNSGCSLNYDGTGDQEGPKVAVSDNGTYFLYFASIATSISPYVGRIEGYCGDASNTWPAVNLGSFTTGFVNFDRTGLSLKTSADGAIFMAWTQPTSRYNTLAVRKVSCASKTATSLLDFNASSVVSAIPQVSASNSFASVYFNNGGMSFWDYNRSTSAWVGSAALMPTITGYPNNWIISKDNSSNMEAFAMGSRNSKATANDYYLLTRVPGGAWRAAADLGDIGVPQGGGSANVFVGVTGKDEAVATWWDFVDANTANMGAFARLSSSAGAWGSTTRISDTGVSSGQLFSLSVNEVGNARVQVTQSSSTNSQFWSELKPGPLDTTPPVTTSTKTKYSSKGINYIDITLSANEPATTYFRISGSVTITAGGAANTNWQTYTGKITVKLSGTGTLEYYSVDTGGNVEATHTETLQ